MNTDDRKKKIQDFLLNNQFNAAEFMYTFESMDKDLRVALNLTAKQMLLLSPMRSILMSSADHISEDEFHAILMTILSYAQSKDVEPMDLLKSMLYMMVNIMQTFGIVISDKFAEIRKEDEDLSHESLSEWIKKRVVILTTEEMVEMRKSSGECDGDCANCNHEDDDEDETCDSSKLH